MLARSSQRPARPFSRAGAGLTGADSAGRTEFPQWGGGGGTWAPSDGVVFASTEQQWLEFRRVEGWNFFRATEFRGAKKGSPQGRWKNLSGTG